jgi:hypothetical protein
VAERRIQRSGRCAEEQVSSGGGVLAVEKVDEEVLAPDSRVDRGIGRGEVQGAFDPAQGGTGPALEALDFGHAQRDPERIGRAGALRCGPQVLERAAGLTGVARFAPGHAERDEIAGAAGMEARAGRRAESARGYDDIVVDHRAPVLTGAGEGVGDGRSVPFEGNCGIAAAPAAVERDGIVPAMKDPVELEEHGGAVEQGHAAGERLHAEASERLGPGKLDDPEVGLEGADGEVGRVVAARRKGDVALGEELVVAVVGQALPASVGVAAQQARRAAVGGGDEGFARAGRDPKPADVVVEAEPAFGVAAVQIEVPEVDAVGVAVAEKEQGAVADPSGPGLPVTTFEDDAGRRVGGNFGDKQGREALRRDVDVSEAGGIGGPGDAGALKVAREDAGGAGAVQAHDAEFARGGADGEIAAVGRRADGLDGVGFVGARDEGTRGEDKDAGTPDYRGEIETFHEEMQRRGVQARRWDRDRPETFRRRPLKHGPRGVSKRSGFW